MKLKVQYPLLWHEIEIAFLQPDFAFSAPQPDKISRMSTKFTKAVQSHLYMCVPVSEWRNFMLSAFWEIW